MTIRPDFSPTVQGPNIRFTGFDLDGKPAAFSLRVKTETLADEFAEVLRKEVEAIKSEDQ